MKYRKKPVVIEAFQYDGDLKNSDGEISSMGQYINGSDCGNICN